MAFAQEDWNGSFVAEEMGMEAFPVVAYRSGRAVEREACHSVDFRLLGILVVVGTEAGTAFGPEGQEEEKVGCHDPVQGLLVTC